LKEFEPVEHETGTTTTLAASGAANRRVHRHFVDDWGKKKREKAHDRTPRYGLPSVLLPSCSSLLMSSAASR
jgi:hypothetical protein